MPSEKPPGACGVPVGLPVLVGCSHGTRDPAGRRAIARLRLDTAAARPGLEVVAAHVDVHKPALDDVVARLAAEGRACVVVPLLLSGGYHVRTDVARAVSASKGFARAAVALGADEALADVLVDRLTAAGYRHGDAVVLGAAGSSDPDARADVEEMADLLADRLGTSVSAAYLSAASPSVEHAVSTARRAGGRVVVANYLLAAGVFADRLAQSGADAVSAPLAPHRRLADLVLRRYDEARPAGWVP